MKKFSIALLALVATACTQAPKPVTNSIISDNVKFCESICFKGDTLLIANFGGEQLNPLNTDGKGYILACVDGVTSTFIAADSTLSAPKGMLVNNNYLYVADVNKVVVYNLSQPNPKGLIVELPTGELFVNDLALSPLGDKIYVTVTNTGNIYSFSTAATDSLSKEDVVFYTNVVGANGILVADDKMYIASYPADGNTTEANTIYVIDNISKPEARPLINRAGQYDGLAIDGDKLYFSNWVDSEIGYVNMTNGEVAFLPMTTTPVGPARIVAKNGALYIPDLPGSQVIVVGL